MVLLGATPIAGAAFDVTVGATRHTQLARTLPMWRHYVLLYCLKSGKVSDLGDVMHAEVHHLTWPPQVQDSSGSLWCGVQEQS